MSDDRNYTISSSPCQQSAMTPLKRRLPPTIKTEVSPHNPLPPPLPLFQDETDSKEVDIQCCLTGASDHQSVDLIQLRELASSSGGLKTIALRRQAWPKLLASHQVLLEGPRVSRPPTSPDLRAIQRLVQRTKWSKHQITKSPKTFDELLGLMLQSEISPMRTPSITEPDSFTNRIRRVSFDLDLDDSEEPSHRQLLQLAKEERKVLRKLLIHIHRCHPDTPLYDGMQNLLAVLWIVLETPSLTSITSLQLIQFHWRPQPSDFFMRLLSLWDPILYQHFHFLGYDQTPSCIADSWIPHWFSNDLNDLEVLLRIWDLLIVSPPTTIIYFSVALTVHFREPLLRANQRPIFQAILNYLPSDGLEKYNMVELILERCRKSLNQFPQELLIKSPLCIPDWVRKTTAPTDYQVLQRLLHSRQRSTPTPNGKTSIVNSIVTTKPRSPPIIATTLLASTPRRAFPLLESPDATPCSTPESVTGFVIKRAISPKASTENIFFDTSFKGLVLGLICIFLVAVTCSYVLNSSQRNAKNNITLSEPLVRPATNVVTPVSAPVTYSTPLSAKAQDTTHADRQDNIQGPPNREKWAFSLETNTDALLHDHANRICHPSPSLMSPVPYLEDFLTNRLSDFPFDTPMIKNLNWVLKTKREQQLLGIVPTECPYPFEIQADVFMEPSISQEEFLSVDLVNLTWIDHYSNLTNDGNADDYDNTPLKPSTVSSQNEQGDQDNVIDPIVMDTTHSKVGFWMMLGRQVGFPILKTIQLHVEARGQAQSVQDRVRKKQIDAAKHALKQANNQYKKASVMGQQRIQAMSKSIHTRAQLATVLAFEIVKIRLEASLVARQSTTQMALNIAQSSKNRISNSIDQVFAVLLSTDNMTLNSPAETGRLVRHLSLRTSMGRNQTRPAILFGLQSLSMRCKDFHHTLTYGSLEVSKTISKFFEKSVLEAGKATQTTILGLMTSLQASDDGYRRSTRAIESCVTAVTSTVSNFKRSTVDVSLGKLSKRLIATLQVLDELFHGIVFGLSKSIEMPLLICRNVTRTAVQVFVKVRRAIQDVPEQSTYAVGVGSSFLEFMAKRCAKKFGKFVSNVKRTMTTMGEANIEFVNRTRKIVSESYVQVGASWAKRESTGGKTEKGLRAVKNGQTMSFRLVDKSGRLAIAGVKSGTKVIVREGQGTNIAVDHGSSVARAVIKGHSSTSLQLFSRWIPSGSESVNFATKTAIDLALLSTNTTLNLIGKSARKIFRASGCMSKAASDFLFCSGKKTLQKTQHTAHAFYSSLLRVGLLSTNTTLNTRSYLRKSPLDAFTGKNGLLSRHAVSTFTTRGAHMVLLATNLSMNVIGVTTRAVSNWGNHCVQAMRIRPSSIVGATLASTRKKSQNLMYLTRKGRSALAQRSQEAKSILSTFIMHTGDIIEDGAISTFLLICAAIVSGHRRASHSSRGIVLAAKQYIDGIENVCSNTWSTYQETLGSSHVSVVSSITAVLRQIGSILALSRRQGADVFKLLRKRFYVLIAAIMAAKDKLADRDWVFSRFHTESQVEGNVTSLTFDSLLAKEALRSDLRPTFRRARGAVDIAREALLRTNTDILSVDPSMALSSTGKRLSKGSKVRPIFRQKESSGAPSEVLRRFSRQSKDLMIGVFSQGTLLIEMIAQRSFLTVQQRIQAAVGRTMELARLCVHATTAIWEVTSRFLDNVTLKASYVLSVLEMSVADSRRDLIILVQEVKRILAWRKAREWTLLVSYNLIFVLIAFIEVGRNEVRRSSERRLTAVLQVNTEAWRVMQKAAALRMEGMDETRQAIVGTLSKSKDLFLGGLRRIGRRVKKGLSTVDGQKENRLSSKNLMFGLTV